MYIEKRNGEYIKTNSIPKIGYNLDKDLSSCSNGANIDYDNDTKLFSISNLTSENTSCFIYFKMIDKEAFTDISNSSDTGIFTATDDFGTSYYYRGDSDKLNNWVKFAGFYWRIIRVNGNGSIRMIYSGVADGNPSSANKIGVTTQIGTSIYNVSRKDNAYLGYMFGTIGASNYEDTHANINDSTAKAEIDKWYKTNIDEKTDSSGNSYTTYLDTEAGFCNDRAVDNSAFGYTGNGAGRSTTGYVPGAVMFSNNSYKLSQIPTLKCTNKDRDLFTISSSKTGNKKLTYPVGLITSDEVVYAGGFNEIANSSYYLYTGVEYWTMSPAGYGYYNSDDRTRMFFITPNGNIGYGQVIDARGLRPVINLKADIKFYGVGSMINPYVVEENHE